MFGCTRSVAAEHQIITDFRPIRQTDQSCVFDCADVDEYVLAAVIGLYETISFGRVKPFHFTVSHLVISRSPTSQRGERSAHLSSTALTKINMPLTERRMIT